MEADAEQHLNVVLSHPNFSQAERQRQLLRFLVETTVTRRTASLKETVIGVEVFGRPPGYDPKIDSIVRVEAHRLRAKLETYYSLPENSRSALRFHLPKGSYALEIRRRQASGLKLKRLPWRWGGALLAAVAFLASAGWYVGRRSTAWSPVIRQLTFDTGLTTDPAISPDGRFVVYVSDRGRGGYLHLYRQPLGGGAAEQLTQGEQDEHEPAINSDGSVVYRSELDGGGIYRIGAAGDIPDLLAPYGLRPQISPDGSKIVYMVRDERFGPARIFVIASGGGEPRRLAADFADAHNPVWSPSGNAILFCGTQAGGYRSREHDWWVLRLGPGTPVKTLASRRFDEYSKETGVRLRARGDQLGTPVQWQAEGVYFLASQNGQQSLWRLPLNNGSYQASGKPEHITVGGAQDLAAAISGRRIVLASGTQRVDVHEVALDAESGRAAGEIRRLTRGPSPNFQPRYARDSRSIIFVSDRDGKRGIYRQSLEDGKETALPCPAGACDQPVFSGDSSEVAYLSTESGKMAIFRQPIDGRPRRLISADAGAPSSWSKDGRWLLYEPGAIIPFVGLLDCRGGKKSALLRSIGGSLRSPRLSPDGKWVAFQVDTGMEARRIMIAPFRPNAEVSRNEWRSLSGDNDADYLPAWSEDGRLVYFISERDGRRCVWARRFDGRRGAFVGDAFTVLSTDSASRTLLRNYRAGLNRIGLSVRAGRLLFSMDTTATNLWLAERRR